MQYELNQFTRNDVWTLVLGSKEMNVIGTKSVFKNKMDKQGINIWNKARLAVKCCNHEEGIDYNETYVFVARLKVLRLLYMSSYVDLNCSK